MKNNFIAKYVHESFEELHAVTWPTRNQMLKITVIVLVFTLLASAFIAALDFLFNTGKNFLITL